MQFSHHLRISDLFRLSLRTFKGKSVRSFLTTIGIGVGIGMVLFVVSLGFGVRKILIEQLVKTDDSFYSLEASFGNEGGATLQKKDIEDMSKIAGVAEISPVVDLSGELIKDNIHGAVSVKVVDPNYFRLAGIIPSSGEVFRDAHDVGIVLSGPALKLFDIDSRFILGKMFNVNIAMPDGRIEEKALPVRGTIEQEGENSPLIFIPSVVFSEETFAYRTALIRAENAEVVFPLRDILTNRGAFISAKLDLITQATKILNIATILLSVFGATTLIVSAIGMFNTMTISLLERTKEVGIMKVFGATNNNIRAMFLMEAFWIGLFGGLMGLFLGIFFADIFNYGLKILARSLNGKPLDLFVRPLWFMALLMLFATLISLLTGYWPARRSVKLSPADAFKK